MLVLTRKPDQSIMLGSDIEITVLSVRGDQVSLGFKAPESLSIYRKEIYDAMQKENRNAARSRNHQVQAVQHALERKPPPPAERKRKNGRKD